MNKLLGKWMKRIILLLGMIAFIIIHLYINSADKVFRNQYTESFDRAVVQYNMSITEFLSSFENAIEMFSKNEIVQYVSDYPQKYYKSTLDLFKTFQESYASTAFAYFAPKEKVFETKKIISWPDTSEALSTNEWILEKRPWYVSAIKSKGEIGWTRPYMDATTNKYIITASKEVLDKENKFKGVIAIDLYLEDISKKINYFKEYNEGYLFVISRKDGEDFFILEDEKNEKVESLFDKKMMDTLCSQEVGNFYIRNKTGEYYISFATNKLTGWKIVGIIEEDKLNKGVKDITGTILFGVITITLIAIISIFYITKQMKITIQTLSNSIHVMEEKISSSDEKLPLFKLESEEVLFEKENSNIDILFKIEWEKKRINKQIENINSIKLLQVRELKTSIKKLMEYGEKLDFSIKSHEIQEKSIRNFLIEILEIINSVRLKAMDKEVDTVLKEIEESINHDIKLREDK